MSEGVPRRRQYLNRLTMLKSQRSSWDSHWRDLSEQIEPRRSRFFVDDHNRGEKRNQHIINNTPVRAKATLAAGMQSGLTNQSRPWFRLVAPTPELSESEAVKEWLHTVEEVMREVMARSNIYNSFHLLYGDLAVFGTALMYIEEDAKDVIRCWVFPIGSYVLALDSRGRVDSVYRETTMTVKQLVDEFGLEACSQPVQHAYEQKSFDQSIKIVQVIEPNADYQHGKMGPKGMQWVSCWFEFASADDSQMLRDSGFNEFPCMGPRWVVNGEDTYGSSPGMEALGDCRALQLYERRNAQAFDKVVNPPMKGPSSLNGQKISLLPGDTTYTDAMSPASAFSPAHEIQAQALLAFAQKIEVVERHIKDAFYANLWLALTQQDGSMTAREVGERHEEKMLQLGPVTERLGDELYDPAIDRIFAICDRRGLFPPAPPELAGADLKIEYISTMAAAQKLIGTMAIERLAAFVGNLVAANPDSIDTVDLDQAVVEYGSALGVPPKLIRSAEALAAIRKAKQQAKQAQAMQQQLLAGAQGAKTLSETDLGGDNALNRLLATQGSAPLRS